MGLGWRAPACTYRHHHQFESSRACPKTDSLSRRRWGRRRALVAFGRGLGPFFCRRGLFFLLPGCLDRRRALPLLDELDGVANVLRAILRALDGVGEFRRG